ncbi:hypothetical protein [Haloechinothrix sp. LS1_15]|uniref:hypothetical protein n=1 Tax=Haloechinothrix sp. LS1_15 TaxID=2652248 RepID=UPI0029456446|nr:hypothetical protein [Haloechinothrix sp. LS1_15]MDV6010982.1 hypothetical protein [Haloechinothrix sp. LS1_15]
MSEEYQVRLLPPNPNSGPPVPSAGDIWSRHPSYTEALAEHDRLRDRGVPLVIVTDEWGREIPRRHEQAGEGGGVVILPEDARALAAADDAINELLERHRSQDQRMLSLFCQALSNLRVGARYLAETGTTRGRGHDPGSR